MRIAVSVLPTEATLARARLLFGFLILLGFAFKVAFDKYNYHKLFRPLNSKRRGSRNIEFCRIYDTLSRW